MEVDATNTTNMNFKKLTPKERTQLAKEVVVSDANCRAIWHTTAQRMPIGISTQMCTRPPLMSFLLPPAPLPMTPLLHPQ